MELPSFNPATRAGRSGGVHGHGVWLVHKDLIAAAGSSNRMQCTLSLSPSFATTVERINCPVCHRTTHIIYVYVCAHVSYVHMCTRV